MSTNNIQNANLVAKSLVSKILTLKYKIKVRSYVRKKNLGSCDTLGICEVGSYARL